jgi:hypothetical protein
VYESALGQHPPFSAVTLRRPIAIPYTWLEYQGVPLDGAKIEFFEGPGFIELLDRLRDWPPECNETSEGAQLMTLKGGQ